jgi:DNA-binding transcriptional LysR family regulator
MNLVQVRMFCLSATLGSVSEAARAMEVTQSAVSKGLSRLQEEEGVRLLEIRRGRLVLTQAGEAFLPVAKRLLEQETVATQCLREFRQGETVSILTSETFGIYYLPAILRRMRFLWPTTRVRVDLAHNASIEERVSRCSHDVGILSRPGRNPDLSYFHLLDDDLALVCAIGHDLSGRSVAPRALGGLPFVLHEAGSVPRLLAEEFFARHHLEVEVPMEVSHVESLKVLVRENAGIAFVSRRSVLPELEDGALGEIDVVGETLARSFYFVHRRERTSSIPMRHLYHTIRDLEGGGEGAIHDVASASHDSTEWDAPSNPTIAVH